MEEVSSRQIQRQAVNMEGIPWSHLVPVPEHYQTVGLRIENTHMRGLTVEMLEELADIVQKVLETGYTITDKVSGKEVTMDTMNLYHLDEHFIRPLTKAHQCSFVELSTKVKTKEEAIPNFFVSHWWGTPLVDTIRMLNLHKKNALSIKDGVRYSVWICAFANRQHSLHEEIPETDNFFETAFARSILSAKCHGTILLLNEGLANPLERSWCIFEAFVSLTQCGAKGKPQRFDIATIVPAGCFSKRGKRNLRCAGIITQTNGLSSRVDSIGYMTTDHPKDKGTIRPAAFPVGLCLRGLQINVLEADATRTADKERIERWIGNQSNEVNLALQKKFIAPALYAVFVMLDPEVAKNVLRLSTSITSQNEVLEIIKQLELVQKVLEIPSELESDREIVANFLKVPLEYGWDPNIPYDSVFDEVAGDLPLGAAIIDKHYEAARTLLEGGADPSKLAASDLREIDYANCPEDIKQRLRESGVLCKGRCLSYLSPCVGCWLFCRICYAGIFCSKKIWNSLDRAD